MTSPEPTNVLLGARRVADRPLTPIQDRIWASQRLSPGVPLANMATVHRIRRVLDPERWVDAVDRVVRSSDALRMVVAETSGRPVARVLAEPPARTTVVDLPAADVEAWTAARVAVPVDATRSVYDSVLLRHADDDWSWWLDLHHVATDAASSALVFDRVAAAYGDPGLELEPNGFFDWAADEIDGDAAGALGAFWSERSVERVAATPYGRPGPRTTRVRRSPVTAPAGLADALSGPFRSFGTQLSLTTVMCTAAAVLLHRLDGRPTVVAGVPVHHRSGARAAGVIGPLLELVPVVVEIDRDDTFADLFARTQGAILDVLRHARPGSSPSSSGFDVVVNNLAVRYGPGAGRIDDDEVEVSWVRSGHVEAAHPLRFHAHVHDGGHRLEIDVNEGLSADGSHRRLPEHLERVLAEMVADPAMAIGGFDLVTPDELELLDALNPPAPVDPALRPVHDVIAGLLRADPERVTAEEGGRTVTAGELDAAAARTAARLVADGVGRGDRVGIRMRRSVDVLVAIHGILRAGAAFVLLDPDDPPARHEAIAVDAGLVTILDELPDPPSPEVPVVMDESVVGLDDLAYVLYTSGSTGTPKGVPVSHRGLADYLRFAVDAYAPSGAVVMPLHSSLVFDLTITSLFLPQLLGGRTVIVPGAPLEALATIARRPDLTVLKGTPSQLELLARMIDEPLGLEVVIVGGEAFRRPVAAAFADRCRPGVRIFNEYGPTEAVVGCMIHEWKPALDTGSDVPIGTACPGAEVYVLDGHGRRTPVGAWGELYVRRPGMATGYLHLPELSAERFAPVAAVDDRPLYRTGDRVRVDRGVLVYGGRDDDQLQLDGIRLEPGEIEAALVTHPSVRSAVVRVWTPGSGRIVRCIRCGLGTDVPDVTIDDAGVCSTCRAFEQVEPRTRSWFRTPADLDDRLADARRRRRGEFDALHLLSGGKDSTYALYQLVERGWRVHALTLDNGYISDGAKANIARSVADLGISHEFVTTEAMPEIFRDSLERFANVCNGCYKAIYTLATARAHELGIPVIVTGLSRGQFFETRLVPNQFTDERFDPDAIDATVLAARRAYHRTTDAVTRLLPEQRVFERDDRDVLAEIEYVDFYRYVDVELAEMYEFLEQRAPWVRPADTGRSTNCLINVAGIHVHRTERGYHNYAEPYSWDVRLGHKTRHEALEELDDVIDLAEVERMLDEIGYRPRRPEVLTAWYQTDDGAPIDPTVLRSHLRDLLPDRSIPAAFVHVDAVPLADSAKVDVGALPPPRRLEHGSATYVEPATATEAIAADVWARVLEIDRVGRDDDFFDLGGSSLPALEAVVAMEEALGVELPDALVFTHRTLREFGAAADEHLAGGTRRERIPDLRGERRPLTPGEEAMLFEVRANPSDTRYNITRCYRLPGTLDRARFEQALGDVVARHQPLHTAFDPNRTVLASDAALSIRTFDPAVDGDGDTLAERVRRIPFDLDHGPLVRVHVGTTADGGTDVVVAMHHICVDAGTFDLFWDEVDAAYHGRPLPELRTTVAAHGAWQRTRLDDVVSAWDDLLGDVEPGDVVLPRPPEPEADGYLERDAGVSTSELAAGSVSTPFAAAAAAAAAVLAPHTLGGAVELGITASTKDHVDAQPLIGYFLTTLPLRVEVDRTDDLRTLDGLVGERLAATLPHRSVPLAAIVRRARERGAVPPAPRHLLAYERLAPARWGEAAADHRIVASGTAVADLSFIVQERGDALRIGVEYSGRAIGRDDARRLLDAFAHVLALLARHPDRSVEQAVSPLLGDDLVGDPLPTPRTVIERILAMADARPGAPAVIGPGPAALTYGELIERAAELAGRIRAVAPATRRVGVAVPRSTDLVASLLAVQLAGAAYVPLDPSVPRARIDTIVAHADLDVVITASSTADRFAGLAVVDLDATGPGEPVREIPDPADAAYVIFTSGSTGVPAGVVVTHANLAASTAARDVWYGTPPRRFLLTSSAGFDSSVVGLYWPLVTGGAVVLPDDEEVHDVDRLGDLVAMHEVSHLLMVPSLYRALLARRGDRLGSLEVAIVAGEACTTDVADLHHRTLPSTLLVNEYGPTEATVWAAAHRVEPGEAPVRIGSPIPGVRLRLVDDRLRRVAQGAPGELMIAGPTVAAGYVSGRSDDAFVVDADRRWYRTGDLVRVDADRRLVFLGRRDDQLNVGGVRLEPTEVERLMTELPGIVDAVVVGAERGGRTVLVAHLQADPAGPPVDVEAVRRHLTDRVPTAAVPRELTVHRSLPRTAHGKLDRRAAAALPGATTASSTTAVPGAVDHVIPIWREVLGRPDADADADFFALGGDSLAALEIVTRLAELSGGEVPIAALLDAPTPRRMADRLGVPRAPRPERGDPSDQGLASAAGDPGVRLVTMRAGTPDGPVVILTSAWDDVQGYRDLADALPGDVTALATPVVDRHRIDQVAPAVAATLGILPDDLAERGPIVVVGWSIGGVVAHEIGQHLARDGVDVAAIALVDTFFPGEHRHVWANRWSTYSSLVRTGSLGGARREVARVLRRRLDRIAARTGRRLLAWAGETVPWPAAPVATAGGIPFAALDHAPQPGPAPVVFFAASTTNRRRTVIPWQRVAPDLRVVPVEGRHRGPGSIMAAGRVGRIAEELDLVLRDARAS